MTKTYFWKLEIFQISLLTPRIGYSWIHRLLLVNFIYEMLQWCRKKNELLHKKKKKKKRKTLKIKIYFTTSCMHLNVVVLWKTWVSIWSIPMTWIMLAIKQTWIYDYNEFKLCCIDNMWNFWISLLLANYRFEFLARNIEHY